MGSFSDELPPAFELLASPAAEVGPPLAPAVVSWVSLSLIIFGYILMAL